VKKCVIETHPCVGGHGHESSHCLVPFENLETLSAFACHADVTPDLIVPSGLHLRVRNMQSLLRWSIENSSNDADSPSDASTRRVTELDPGVIDAILGRPDAELMKEALVKAQDTSLDEDARQNALDDLEMVRLPASQPTHSLNCPSARREHRQCKWCAHACREHRRC
jgi:hypothetical protein